MELVAFVGEDRENWGQVKALINRFEGEKILIVQNRKAKDFPANGKCRVIEVDSEALLNELKENIKTKIKPELTGDFEVSLSIASGNGKEHMALISALLSIPVGIRLIVFTKEGIEHIN